MPVIAQSSPGVPRPASFESPYVAYTYSYPHKTAYRPLTPSRPLREVWAAERKDALFLYLHVPFCEMRCGFCNLFTTANPADELVGAYVETIRRQAAVVADAIGEARVARVAVGGGTPTFLPAPQLEQFLSIVSGCFSVGPASVSMSVETSPRTAEIDRLRVLKDHGVNRVSIGVQSFIEKEVAASARAQKNSWVDAALQRIRSLAFESLNIDLIYGLPNQTIDTWLITLKKALRWQPEELYLYPLYVRPLTGLDRRGCQTQDQLRLDCYRAGRDLLGEEGYEQVSMRMFRRREALDAGDAVYCCQEDGMVGLGCGARSYTRALHYSTDYAVGAAGVRQIVDSYLARTNEQFRHADYGCPINDDEYRRRWVIKSLLRAKGLDCGAYRAAFGSDALEDFPQLADLMGAGYLDAVDSRIEPTKLGLEWSDAIGPSLFSDQMKLRMGQFELH